MTDSVQCQGPHKADDKKRLVNDKGMLIVDSGLLACTAEFCKI